MTNVSKTLAAVSEAFTAALNEAHYQTSTGKDLFQKYQSATMANAITCNMVNSFIQEARRVSFDSGVVEALAKVCNVVDSNKYSWLLETACEKIESDPRAYSYLNKNAVKLVRPLLEMEEDQVVSYIKAGALKDAMYCEAFRQIAKSVYRDMPVVEQTEQYTCVHPISIVEKVDDSIYFVANGQLYKMNENLTEVSTDWNKVSNDFKVISQLLESGIVKYSTENNGTLTYKAPTYEIQISEEGKCKKVVGEKVYEYTTDQLREQNSLFLNNVTPNQRMKVASILEGVAKCCENYNNIVVIDNVSMFTTKKDQFVMVESNEKTTAHLVRSTHTPNAWSTEGNIYEVLTFIKKKTNVDLSEKYEEKINQVIENTEKEEKEKIEENLKASAIQERKEKVEKLIKEFKDDPVKLAVLSKIALELNTL